MNEQGVITNPEQWALIWHDAPSHCVWRWIEKPLRRFSEPLLQQHGQNEPLWTQTVRMKQKNGFQPSFITLELFLNGDMSKYLLWERPVGLELERSPSRIKTFWNQQDSIKTKPLHHVCLCCIWLTDEPNTGLVWNMNYPPLHLLHETPSHFMSSFDYSAFIVFSLGSRFLACSLFVNLHLSIFTLWDETFHIKL